jgi:hypothetical protein
MDKQKSEVLLAEAKKMEAFVSKSGFCLSQAESDECKALLESLRSAILACEVNDDERSSYGNQNDCG